MPTPTQFDVHVNTPLTNLSIAYIQNASNFVAGQVFANIPVQKQSDLYFKYQRPDWFRAEAQIRAPGTESAGGGFRLTTDSYYAPVLALHKDIDDQTRANTDNPLNMDRDSTMWLTQQLLLKRDIDWAAAYFTTGIWNTDQTGVPGAPSANQFKQWDQSGSTPIEDLRKQIILVAEQTGYRMNSLVLGAHVWRVLQDHAEFLDRIKYTERGMVGSELLASLLGLDKVVVAYAVQNTAVENESATSESNSFILGKSALLGYDNPAPAIMSPAAGYIFSWTGYAGAGAFGNRISTFRMEHLRSDRVEAEMAYTCKLVAADLGKFFTTAVA